MGFSALASAAQCVQSGITKHVESICSHSSTHFITHFITHNKQALYECKASEVLGGLLTLTVPCPRARSQGLLAFAHITGLSAESVTGGASQKRLPASTRPNPKFSLALSPAPLQQHW